VSIQNADGTSMAHANANRRLTRRKDAAPDALSATVRTLALSAGGVAMAREVVALRFILAASDAAMPPASLVGLMPPARAWH